MTRTPGATTRARLLAALALGALLLPAGCQNSNMSKTQKGALAGAVVGAVAGRAIGGHEHAGEGIAIGAVSGAVAGGLLGKYLDQQAQEIDAIPDANVERQADRLIVTFAGDLLFESGSSTLSPGAQQRLGDLARTLNRYPQSRVVIKGHTDSMGSETYNLQLSEQRSGNVRNYLIGQGVNPARLTAIGFGEQFPVASNDSEVGRQQNRRVEIEIVPIEEGVREGAPAGSAY